MSSTITPSPMLWAVVRHSDPPELAPDALLPYVVPSYEDGRVLDWSLTADVVAFGEVDVPTTYQRWRSTWERSWALDPVSSLMRLTRIARSVAAGLGLESDTLLSLAGGEAPADRTIDDPDELLRLADEVERVRDAIRRNDAMGFGFIDVTEDRPRVGLARAWSPSDGPEVLASDEFLEVSMRPASGLHVEFAGSPERSLDAVVEVAVGSSVVEVMTADDVVRLPPAESAPLTWIVPGSARWRVRPVPEVLVWARTFGGLPESCRYAVTISRPLTMRHDDATTLSC